MIKEESRFAHSCLFEGMISVSAVLNSELEERRIEKVYFDEAAKGKKAKELGYIKKMAEQKGFEIEYTTAEHIDSMTTGSSHGGITALCTDRIIPVISPRDIKESGFYVYIEGIEDPYNFGYCVRSLYAAGVDGIILTERNWMSAAGVVCRASAGASELIPMYTDSGNCTQFFKDKGYTVVCTDTKNAVDINDADIKFPVLLIVGGERRGISGKLLSKADIVCKIEYGRKFPQALSAASASAVLAFEILRKNRNGI